jgi:acetyl-CoA C-acetyltransferase
MADAFIYDAVRTPRGKGKSSGALHEITSLQLATQALRAIKDRNGMKDTAKVDDVIFGCVTPIGEQGSDIARIAAESAITNDAAFAIVQIKNGRETQINTTGAQL